jgi:hypothetical protein
MTGTLGGAGSTSVLIAPVVIALPGPSTPVQGSGVWQNSPPDAPTPSPARLSPLRALAPSALDVVHHWDSPEGAGGPREDLHAGSVLALGHGSLLDALVVEEGYGGRWEVVALVVERLAQLMGRLAALAPAGAALARAAFPQEDLLHPVLQFKVRVVMGGVRVVGGVGLQPLDVTGWVCNPVCGVVGVVGLGPGLVVGSMSVRGHMWWVGGWPGSVRACNVMVI